MKYKYLNERVNSNCFAFEFLIFQNSDFDLKTFKDLALKTFFKLDVCAYAAIRDSKTAIIYIRSKKKLNIRTNRLLQFYPACLEYLDEGCNVFTTGGEGRRFAIEQFKGADKSFVFNFFYNADPSLYFLGSARGFAILESSIYFPLGLLLTNPGFCGEPIELSPEINCDSLPEVSRLGSSEHKTVEELFADLDIFAAEEEAFYLH